MATIAMVSVVAVGVVLTIPRYLRERDMMEAGAVTYASLVVQQVAHSANLYRTTGRHILDRRVGELMALNPDLVRLEVVHVGGEIVLQADVSGALTLAEQGQAQRTEDPETLRMIQSLKIEARRVRDSSGQMLYQVVAPAVEEWGRRTYSLVAYFGYDRVDRELLHSVLVVGSFLAVALFLARRAAVFLAGSITANIERLRDGVGRIREGHLDERVKIDSHDEVEELAAAFNAMADTMADTIQRLRETYRELEVLDQTKADVIANVSHELKTPLTALRGYLELLAQGDLGQLTDEAARSVSVCRKNLRRLDLRIEELVQLSQWERRVDVTGPSEEVHLGHLLHGVVETLLPSLEEKGVYCSLNLATDLPPVVGNSGQVEQVFFNLLGNAGKFTSAGGSIRVTAEPRSRDDQRGVLVQVEDSGIGIPKNALLRIFDRFYQVDPSTRRKYGGMGLGLALVQSIMEAHRGAIWVESVEGKGSTFSVWFPLRPSDSGSGAFSLRRRTDPDTMRSEGQRGQENQ